MASKICKIVYFDEDSVTDYVQIVAGGTLEKTTELLNSSDLSEEQKADVSAKGGIGGVFKALLGWEASASGEVSAGLALNRNKMVKNIVKNTILTDFLHIIDENENKSASKTTRGAIKSLKDMSYRQRKILFPIWLWFLHTYQCCAQDRQYRLAISILQLISLRMP